MQISSFILSPKLPTEVPLVVTLDLRGRSFYVCMDQQDSHYT